MFNKMSGRMAVKNSTNYFCCDRQEQNPIMIVFKTFTVYEIRKKSLECK